MKKLLSLVSLFLIVVLFVSPNLAEADRGAQGSRGTGRAEGFRGRGGSIGYREPHEYPGNGNYRGDNRYRGHGGYGVYGGFLPGLVIGGILGWGWGPRYYYHPSYYYPPRLKEITRLSHQAREWKTGCLSTPDRVKMKHNRPSILMSATIGL